MVIIFFSNNFFFQVPCVRIFFTSDYSIQKDLTAGESLLVCCKCFHLVTKFLNIMLICVLILPLYYLPNRGMVVNKKVHSVGKIFPPKVFGFFPVGSCVVWSDSQSDQIRQFMISYFCFPLFSFMPSLPRSYLYFYVESTGV